MGEETPPQDIDFRRIVEKALSPAATSVFIGACVIVWRGATTVDERVWTTEQSLRVLIGNLSGKLSGCQAQPESQSDELAGACAGRKCIKGSLKPDREGAGSADAAVLHTDLNLPAYRGEERAQMPQQGTQRDLMRKPPRAGNAARPNATPSCGSRGR